MRGQLDAETGEVVANVFEQFYLLGQLLQLSVLLSRCDATWGLHQQRKPGNASDQKQSQPNSFCSGGNDGE
ncbi:MAG: hypothetical protein ACKPJJ_09550 [Planctomycetaceae bacterium]